VKEVINLLTIGAFLSQTIMILFQFLVICKTENGLVTVHDGVLSYAYGQLTYSIILAILNIYFLSFKKVNLFPKSVFENGSWIFFDNSIIYMSVWFMAQSFVKHLLTYGDKFALVLFGDENSQKGAYHIVSSLGSLVARILFHPLEETSRALFSKNLTNNDDCPNRSELVQESRDLLVTLIQFNILFGCFFIFFGSNYTHILLHLLYRKGKTDGPRVLSVYCIYVPIMGINGVTEAFLQAVGNSNELLNQTIYLSLCWVILFIASYFLLIVMKLGSVGLVIANILNLTLRIIFSLCFISKFFKKCKTKGKKIFKIQSIINVGSNQLYFSFIISWLLTNHFNFGIDSYAAIISHVSIGSVCLAFTAYLMFEVEKDKLLLKLYKYFKNEQIEGVDAKIKSM
jgi:oligosaccharide translocation protein RFT1